MDVEKKQIKNLLWVIPAVTAFFIALIPTLTHQWPLTLDIIFHVHVANVYSHYGLTLIDPLIDPGMGYKIGYPPLFSLVIAFLGNTAHIDYFTVARILQPVLAFSVVLSVSYVAKKFYGDVAGISAGFLMMSSYLFSRLFSPLPETMALIFIPLVIYFYYESVKNKKYLPALISGFLFLLVILTHQGATLILFLVITAIAIIMTILRRKIRFFTGYLAVMAVPLGAAAVVIILLFLMAPKFLQTVLTGGISTITGLMMSLPDNQPISNLKYAVYLGILLLFAFIGAVSLLKKRRDRDIIIFTWIGTIFLISKAYWFGVNVYTMRVLVYLLIPLSILGGFGLSYLYQDFKSREFPSKPVRSVFLIVTILIALLFAIVTVEDPNLGLIPKYNASPYGGSDITIPQLAPPTASDVDLEEWFSKNGNKSYVLVSNNYYTSQFLLATTQQPIASSQTSEHYIRWEFERSEMANLGTVYFVYDKRLTFSSEKDPILTRRGPFIFYNKNYDVEGGLPSYAKLVHNNTDYSVFQI